MSSIACAGESEGSSANSFAAKFTKLGDAIDVLWTYQELLFETRPDVIVETGTCKGGSALYFANLFDLMGKGRIISVDVNHRNELPCHPRIHYITGSSIGNDIQPAVQRQLAPKERVMVILDSDHSQKHVAEELRFYAGLVSPACHLVVEDTNVNGHPVDRGHGPGRMEALREFLAEHPQFERDLNCERHKLTFFPGGWLKRLSSNERAEPVAPPRVGTTIAA